MRSLTVPVAAKLDQKLGTEPIIVVEIQWVDGGNRLRYADRKVLASDGQITDIGSIDMAMKTDGTTDSNQVSLTLDDTSGYVKDLCDAHDLHKRPAWVYQWFDGLDPTDLTLLFKGEVNSPFAWNEGDRTVSFDIMSKIEDVEVGFSMEEGDFPIVPTEILGQAWPLAFGTVCDVKALQVRSPRAGTLQLGEGIRDYTLESRICQARYIQCANVALGDSSTATSESEMTFTDEGVVIFTNLDTTAANGPEQSCVESRFHTICELMYQRQQQMVYEHSSFTVLDATRLQFPQNQLVTLNINSGIFTGTFSGDVFTVHTRLHPDATVTPPSTCTPVGDRQFDITGLLDTSDWQPTESGSAWYDASTISGTGGGTNLDPTDIANFCNVAYQMTTGMGETGGPVESQKLFDDMITSNFFWAQAGSKVYLEAEAEVLYIVNLLPCTILHVAAKRDTIYGEKLVTVPAEFYTIYETNYGDFTVTEIGMTKPLSERTLVVTHDDGTTNVIAAGWSDDLYVTVTSSIGPNPVDIIEWLIDNHTDLTVDAVSFAYVKARLADYPAGFVLQERINVMQLISDIAHQSRCTTTVRDGVLFIQYASEEPTSVVTLTESDVLVNTLKITLSNTDELGTKYKVRWRRSEFEGDLSLMLKNHAQKYGVKEKSFDYYTNTIYDNVLKSASFWLIRDSNVWKIVEFTTSLQNLDLEVFDCVTLNLSDLSATPVKAVITAVKYDVPGRQVSLTLWTPIRAGETTPYQFAWPADLSVGTVYPTAEERLLNPPLFSMAPPPGHLLYIAEEDDGQPTYRLTSGDEHPSDLDDALSVCVCPRGMSSEEADALATMASEDPSFKALKLAQQASRSATSAAMNTGGTDNVASDTSTAGDEKKRERVCGETVEATSDCQCEIHVMTVLPETVLHADAVACADWGTGSVCTGPLSTYCVVLGSEQSKTELLMRLKAQQQMAGEYGFTVGKRAIYMVVDGPCGGDCVDRAYDGILSNPYVMMV